MMVVRPTEGETRAAPDWLAARRTWSSRAVMFGALVGVVVCLLSVILRTEIVASDPWAYVRAARDFPDDSWVPLGYTRYGMILPRVPLVWVFDNSEITYYFWPVLSSGLLAACMFLIAYRFWGNLFGLLAAFLALSSPITFINLSRGYPDIQSTAVMALAVVVAFVVRDRLVANKRALWWQWLAIGLLLGWGVETRETTLLIWPIIAVVLWTRGVAMRGLALLASGIAAWAVLDILIGWIAYGDPLIRMHVFTGQDLANTSVVADQAAKSEFVGRSRAFYLAFIPKVLVSSIPGGVWSLGIGVLAVAGVAFRGGSRFVSIWFLVSYVTFVGITGGFFPDHPSGRVDLQRYWICFLPIAGLAAAGTTAEIAAVVGRNILPVQRTSSIRFTQRAVNLGLAVVVAVGPLLSLGLFTARNEQLMINGADQLSQLRSYLASTDTHDARILTDFATYRVLPIYQHGPFGGREAWSGDVVNIEAKPGPKAGDLVVVNSLDNDSCFFCNDWINKWYEKNGPVPDDWDVLFRSDRGNLVLYRVN